MRALLSAATALGVVLMIGVPLACVGVAAWDEEKRAEDLAQAIRDDAVSLAPEGATQIVYDSEKEVLIWTEDGDRCTAEVVFAGDGALRDIECRVSENGG